MLEKQLPQSHLVRQRQGVTQSRSLDQGARREPAGHGGVDDRTEGTGFVEPRPDQSYNFV